MTHFTDCTGAKPVLQTRLQRVDELKAKLVEGDGLCESLASLLTKIPDSLPVEAKETFDNDLQNLKYVLNLTKHYCMARHSTDTQLNH